MDNLEEIRKVRIQKLENLKKAGMNPFTANVSFTHTNAEAIDGFKKLAGKPDKEGVVQKGKEITLVGRVRSLRGHGGSTFCHIEDGYAKIQLYLKKDLISDANYDLFINNIDLGDFIEAKGKLFLTQKGEQTLQVLNWRILTKSIMPIPSEWYGLEDTEEKLRKRYLDILTNPEIKEMFVKKSRFWQTMRSFLIEKGFMEVETPVLENTTGGAEARPFITHHNALDLDVYLRISDELWLKRLIVAGYPKVFEIGRIFRNEGMDAEHLQDYTQMEFYWAFADYNDGMKLIEEMYKKIAKEVYGKTKFEIKGFSVDFAKKWEIYDYVETIKKMTDIDVLNSDLKTIENKLNELKVDYDKKGFNVTRAIDGLWKYCRKDIAGPGFLINVPVTMEPLAKRMEKDNNLVERFQVILAGSELGKGFSELNDPIDQLGRFNDQQKLREGGDEEAQMTDNDFVEALEYGMPPTCGFGVSERLFAFLEGKPIRETVIFPLMRPKK
jgi:lysyl-tRNA synthetase class 2